MQNLFSSTKLKKREQPKFQITCKQKINTKSQLASLTILIQDFLDIKDSLGKKTALKIEERIQL